MEFIGLSTAVARIADCVRLDPHLDDSATAIGDISRAAADKFWQENNPKIEWARSFGIAALILNKALHNSNMPPQWMEFDKQKRFAVKNDAVKQEGIELLTHATGWGNREQGNYSLHFFNAITQGEDALEMPIARGLNDGLAPDGKMLRFLNIGFDRAELVAFLDKNQIDHDLTPSPAPEPQAAPVVAVGVSETKEKRQDRRLNLCEDAGLVMPKSHLSRLPDGVGSIASREGVTRQAFSTDVRAALKRRESAIREGETVSRT